MSMQAEPGIVKSKSHEGQQEVDLLVDLRLLISEYIGNIVYNDKLETWDIIERKLFIVSIKMVSYRPIIGQLKCILSFH